MPNPNITYEEYLEMFGTQEQKDAWNKKKEMFEVWLRDVPVYELNNRKQGDLIVFGRN